MQMKGKEAVNGTVFDYLDFFKVVNITKSNYWAINVIVTIFLILFERFAT